MSGRLIATRSSPAAAQMKIFFYKTNVWDWPETCQDSDFQPALPGTARDRPQDQLGTVHRQGPKDQPRPVRLLSVKKLVKTLARLLHQEPVPRSTAKLPWTLTLRAVFTEKAELMINFRSR